MKEESKNSKIILEIQMDKKHRLYESQKNI